MSQLSFEKVNFYVGRDKLVGHLYRPSKNNANSAGLVFTGPYTGVKEQVTGHYAEQLALAGFTTVAFDHRNFGESDGYIRQHEDPNAKIEDLQAATSFLATQDGVDAERLGAVGICLGGSYALRFAGFDPRIKALATVAAAYVGFPPSNDEESAQKTRWLETYGEELQRLAEGKPTRIPAVSNNPDEEVGMPGQEPFDYYGTKRSNSPYWINEVTRLSSYNLAGFDSIAAIRHLDKTPTLIVHGTTDAFCSPENAERVHKAIPGEKKIEWIETTNHIELYDSPAHVAQSIGHVNEWMSKHIARDGTDR